MEKAHSGESGRRKRHWWRWIIGGVAAILVLIVAAVVLFIKLQPSPAPLALPNGKADPPSGVLDGEWSVGSGSLAGFRVKETAVGVSNYVVGRTSAVTGTLTVSDDQVNSATFHINLTDVTVNGKAEPQFQRSLGTAEHPNAVFTLTKSMALGPGFVSGGTATVSATGDLSMNGVSRLVTFTVTSRRSGNEVEVSGSVPIQFSEWAIQGPAGAGFLGSLANNGVAEFLLYLQHS